MLEKSEQSLVFPKKPTNWNVDRPKMLETVSFLKKELDQVKNNKKKLLLFGDYDCDGASSTTVMFLLLRLLDIKTINFKELAKTRDQISLLMKNKINGEELQSLIDQDLKDTKNQVKENSTHIMLSNRRHGYGLSKKSLDMIKDQYDENYPTTIIAMDLGVNSYKDVKILLENNFTVIIIDHHLPDDFAKDSWISLKNQYPDNFQIYDPFLYEKDMNSDYYYQTLCACGLVYEIAKELMSLPEVKNQMLPEIVLFENDDVKVSQKVVLDSMTAITSLALVADCMPLTIKIENETFLSYSWKICKEYESVGELLPILNIFRSITATCSRAPVANTPLINAAGRLGLADAAFGTYLESSESKAKLKYELLENIRQEVRSQSGGAALNLDRDLLTNKGVRILKGNPEEIEEGVIGIAAARASEKWFSPSVYLIPIEKDGITVFKGSMRAGNTNYSCEHFINICNQQGLLETGGGHVAAAGMTVKGDKLEEFVKLSENEVFEQNKNYFYQVSIKEAKNYLKNCQQYLPWGNKHKSALLMIQGSLIGIEAKRKTEDKTIYAYNFHIIDDKKQMIELMVLKKDLTEKQEKILKHFQDQMINVPFVTIGEVYDNFKLNSKYDRVSLRVSTFVEEVNGSLQQVPFFKFLPNELSDFNNENLTTIKAITEVNSTREKKEEIVVVLNHPSINHQYAAVYLRPMWTIKNFWGNDFYNKLRSIFPGRWNDTLKLFEVEKGYIDLIMDKKQKLPKNINLTIFKS